MYDISIKIKNYKCYIEESGFDTIKRVNLIIGKNNVGKSALLDVIEHVAGKKYEFDRTNWRDGQKPVIVFKDIISANVAKLAIPPYLNLEDGKIQGSHHEYGQKLIDHQIKWTKIGDSRDHVQLLECDDSNIDPLLKNSGYDKAICSEMLVPLEGKKFKKVSAERDIQPELTSTPQIFSNGRGITNAIQCFINNIDLQREIVEIEILKAINEIFAQEGNFSRIVCQNDNGKWEIYLEELDKGHIALSKSGSGLKTVITVLAFLFLIPKIENKSLSEYIFAFEELENNIHPSLLRRLNDYIYKLAVDRKFVYFLTTHSNVLIDQFSKQIDAQIIHVTQKDGEAKTTTVQTYFQSGRILDDLDVRASDLLQANGVIWVEGPSDRLYLNRWIDLWSKGRLKEGTHFQIIFYGGRVLSHFSAESPEEISKSVSMLLANRNSIILIDSDKKKQSDKINDTKIRIVEEFKTPGFLSWVTKGKEIENYISSKVINEFLAKTNSSQVKPFESFFKYLDKGKKGLNKKYSIKKPLFAEKILPFMTKDNMCSVLDLDEKMIEICQRISSWNRLDF